MTCVCGDADDEHESTRMGYGGCTIEGCVCICFEEDEEEDGDA